MFRPTLAIFVFAAFNAAFVATASAQEPQTPASSMTITASATNVQFTDDQRGLPAPQGFERGRSWTGPLLASLHVATFATQMLDVHSTTQALKYGASEANPMMSGLVKNRAAFIGVKAAMSAGLVMMTHEVGKRNKVGAIVMAAAVNSVYLAVANHNYKVARTMQAVR